MLSPRREFPSMLCLIIRKETGRAIFTVRLTTTGEANNSGTRLNGCIRMGAPFIPVTDITVTPNTGFPFTVAGVITLRRDTIILPVIEYSIHNTRVRCGKCGDKFSTC